MAAGRHGKSWERIRQLEVGLWAAVRELAVLKPDSPPATREACEVEIRHLKEQLAQAVAEDGLPPMPETFRGDLGGERC